MKILEQKSIQRIKRSADQVFSQSDIFTTDNNLLYAAQKIFFANVKDIYDENNLSIYKTRTYNHPTYPNIQVSPHFIRDDGVIIYLEIKSGGTRVLHTKKSILHLTMNILKIKTTLVYTIELGPNVNVKTIHNLSDKNLLKTCVDITCRNIKYVGKIVKHYLDSQTKKKIKRSPSPSPNEKNQRRRPLDPIKGFNPNEWVSATKTRNFALNDTLVDWLDQYGNGQKNKKINNFVELTESVEPESDESTESDEMDLDAATDTDSITCTDFDKFIMQRGTQFEKRVVNLIRSKINPEDFVTVCSSMDNFYQRVVSYEKKTISEMKKGRGIIYQPVLLNRSGPLAHSYGIPDLLVRSDYLDYVTDMNPYDRVQQKIPAPNLGARSYHYIVLDIKFTTLELCADGERIRNNGNFPAYKCQLYIYNHALGQIQGFEPPAAYILGRKFTYESHGIVSKGTSCFDRLGHIKYNSWDNTFIDETIGAVKWIQRLRSEGSEWKLYPEPSTEELYPNMCATQSNNSWGSFKESYARDIGEITLLWGCGPINRVIAHQNGIYSFKNTDCSAEMLGIKGRIKGPILNKIIHINQKTKFKSVLDRLDLQINPTVDNAWLDDGDVGLRICIDFETINNVFDNFAQLPLSSNSTHLFLIGVSYKIRGKAAVYKLFLTAELTTEAEYQLITQFYDFVRSITDKYLGPDEPIPLLYHWGHIERTLFAKVCKKINKVVSHGSDRPLMNGRSVKKVVNKITQGLNFYDLSACFQRNPIVLNGCFKFGIKEIVKRLHSLGLVKTSWDRQNPCHNGNTAMILAHNAYKESAAKSTPVIKNPNIRNIIAYNQTDCTVIHEIIDLLIRKVSQSGEKITPHI